MFPRWVPLLARIVLVFWVMLGVLLVIGALMPLSRYPCIGQWQIGFDLSSGTLCGAIIFDSTTTQLPVLDHSGFRNLSTARITLLE